MVKTAVAAPTLSSPLPLAACLASASTVVKMKNLQLRMDRLHLTSQSAAMTESKAQYPTDYISYSKKVELADPVLAAASGQSCTSARTPAASMSGLKLRVAAKVTAMVPAGGLCGLMTKVTMKVTAKAPASGVRGLIAMAKVTAKEENSSRSLAFPMVANLSRAPAAAIPV